MSVLRLAAPFVAALLLTTPAPAAMLSFGAEAYETAPGGALWIPVRVLGLDTDPTREIVSAFDLDVLYDPAILSFRGIEFDAALGIPDVDAFTDSVATPGRIDFSAVSLLSDAELLLRQSADVTLARLLFEAIGIGRTALSFDTLVAPGALLVGGEPYERLALERLGEAVVSVDAVVPVPEPGSFALLLLGLAAMAAARAPVRRARARIAPTWRHAP